ncbi:MAG: gamma-glutamyl-gamma-aminobutyrate hydrolase family protein [Anaerolineales bacterium]
MLSPLIGVTSSNMINPKYNNPIIYTPRSYSRALIKASALPTLIPLNIPINSLDDLLSRFDGIVFTGGGDIETARFGGIDHEEVYDVDPQRDEIEIQLVLKASERGLPFLGICRGHQVVNVALGGKLYTHIADQLENSLPHSYVKGEPFSKVAHSVKLDSESTLAGIAGETEFDVNSLHHQGVQVIGGGLKPVAWAPDGLVEALELPGHPFGLSVQWHPEWLPEDPRSQALFSAFINAASKNPVTI